MSEEKNIWPKRVTVDKRIVKILSQSTYESFPNAIKEIITNSYDADASIVKITVDEREERIVIEDNGKGMSEKEFEFFLRIAGRRREKGVKTPTDRYIIGQFGVGFLASFPFFKNYDIQTTKKGSEQVVKASIPCYRYFSDEKIIDIGDIKISGNVISKPEDKSDRYTRITLTGFTSLTKAFFNSQAKKEAFRNSIKSLSGMEKLIWGMTEDLPVKYEDDRFNSLVKLYSPNVPFQVFVNGDEILRKTHGHILLESNGVELDFNDYQYSDIPLEVDESKVMKFGSISFQYFILTSKVSVKPYEARYFKKRNLNAGVGKRDAFGLGTEFGGARSRTHWLTGEIHILEGLNESINVSRDDFSFNQDYEDIKSFLRKQLRKHSGNLEDEAFYNRESNDQKIKNISFLKPEIEETHEDISSFEPDNQTQISEQESLFPVTHNENESVAPSQKTTSKPLSQSPSEVSNRIPDKVINVNDNNFIAKSGSWNHENELFPACKIDGNKVIINKDYPLFKGVKHTDVFVKLHLLLLINYNEGALSQDVYQKMTEDVLKFYADYL